MYLSAAELLDLEHARLALRRFGFVLDRGRLVREAIAILLADLDARGTDSLVARRLRASLGAVDGRAADGATGTTGEERAASDGQSADDTPSPLPSLAWREMRVAR